MNARLNLIRILIFITFVIVMSWVVVFVVKQSGMMESDATGGMVLANYIIVFLPALANIFTRLVTKEGWRNLMLRPNFKRGWRYYLAAWLLPLLATCVGGGIYFLLYPQGFDPNLSLVRETFATNPELAAQTWQAFLIIFAQTMTLTAIINGLASIGEEFGWRAYLLQKLMILFAGSDESRIKTTGARRAALLVGLIWGVWHFPLFYLGSSLTFPFILIYVIYTCSASVLLSWVALRSGSVWPASLGHGMLNGTTAFPMLLSNDNVNPLLGPGPTGLIGMLGYVILALVLLIHTKAFGEPKSVREN